MPTTRVLHILPHPGGGGEVYVSMLESIPDFVHERFFLSAGRTPSEAAASLPARWPRLVARARAADIIHVHGDVAAILASPLLLARPAVITTHGLHLLRRSRGSTLVAVELAIRTAIRFSRVVVATSTSEMSDLEPVLREGDQTKVRVILTGVEQPPPQTEAQSRAVRAELGIDERANLGIFAGELEPRKEPLLAVGAAERARKAGAPFVLAVAGAGPLSAAVHARASDTVRPLGFRTDLQKLLAAADIFVLPSSREGMSLALLEAMSHGLAIIAAETPSNAEAVAEAGLMFSPGDEIALADALVRLVTDPDMRKRFGIEAKRRVQTAFAADRFLAEIVGVYSALLGSRAPG